MMTSGEVAQMMSAQNSMFSGQHQLANQVGMASPYMGLGGSGYIQPAHMGGFPGMHQGPRPFSYAPTGAMGGGYSGGNRFAANTLAIGGGAAAIGASLMFDPLMSFAGGFMGGIGRGVGAGLMGGMSAAALPLAGGFAAAHAIGSFVHGGQQQMGINTMLGQSYNHFNPQSRTGSGFTRQDAMAVGDSIRTLAHVPEMMTSVEELTKLLPKLKQSGVMQGVKDVTEFQRRFKDAVGTIREMSKVLGSTMEEAEQFFAHSRNMGFLGKTAILKNTLNAQVTSGLTGMSMGQVMQMQGAGADMATSIGARRSLGANAITTTAQNLALAMQQGKVSEQALIDATGLTGDAATHAFSQKMVGAMVNIGQNSVGRFTMAGLAKFDDKGKVIGFDDNLVRRFNEGSLSMSELRRRGMGLNNDQKTSWTYRNEDLMMELAGRVGPGGMARFIEDMAGKQYGSEGVGLILRRQGGMSASEADIAQAMMGVGADEAFSNMGRMRAREADIREKTDPKAIMQRIKTRLHSSTVGGLEQAGAQVATSLGKAYDEYIDELVGRHVNSLSKGGAQALAQAFSGGNKKELMEMFDAASGISPQDRSFNAAGYGKFMAKNLSPIGIAHSMITGEAFEQSKMAARALRSTDAAAFLMRGAHDTGRDAAAELEHFQGLLGMGVGNGGMMARMAGLMGDSRMMGARGTMQEVAAGIHGFREMNNARKFDELRGAAGDRMSNALAIVSGGNTNLAKQMLARGGISEDMLSRVARFDPQAAEMIRAGQIAMGAGAGNDITSALIAGTMGGVGRDDRINLDGIVSAGDGNHLLNVAAAQEAKKKSLDGLRDAGLSETTLAMLQNRPGARAALKEALTNDEVRKAIAADPKVAVELLKKYGVTEGDVVALKGAVDEVTAGGGKRKQLFDAAMGSFETAEKAEGFQVLRAGFAEMSTRMGGAKGGTAQSIAAALRTMSTTRSGTEFAAGLDAVRKGMAALATEASGMRDPSALLDDAGPLGEAVRSSLALTGKYKAGQTVTQEGLLKDFGLTGDAAAVKALSDMGIKGRVKLTKEQVQALQGTVAGLKASSFIAKEGQATTGNATEDKLLTTLDKLDRTIATNATVMAAISNNPDAKKALEALNNPGGTNPVTGQSTPGTPGPWRQ